MSSSLQPHGLYPTSLLCPWDSPGKNTGVWCYFHLHGIFPTQGSNPVSCTEADSFTIWATREAVMWSYSLQRRILEWVAYSFLHSHKFQNCFGFFLSFFSFWLSPSSSALFFFSDFGFYIHSVVSTLCDPTDCRPPGSSVHGDSPSKNIGVGCHALFQGFFPAQGSNPGLLHCRLILKCLSHQGNPFTSITHFKTSGQFSSVAQSCPTLCDSVDCSTPGFPADLNVVKPYLTLNIK